jgi:hypothetical protein
MYNFHFYSPQAIGVWSLSCRRRCFQQLWRAKPESGQKKNLNNPVNPV